uniref:Uncharacterized protein n=1 Tax=Anguilla anguilla TaxID=7936 RepID=A0A0E9QYK3_ANGAN
MMPFERGFIVSCLLKRRRIEI